MNFRQFAFKNVFRNKRLYAGYFFSCAFSVMIFFVYSMLAFHPELSFQGQGNYGKGAQTGMDVAQYIIYVFTFFFILYSMSVFLKSRKKEFGICIMQGMSDMQLRRLVFLENIIIGLAATVSGIAIGLVLSKGMLMLGSSVLSLEKSLAFYMPVKAIWLSFAAFTLLFLFISLFTATILRSSSLIDLLKGTAKPKPEPKASRVLAILAAVLLIIGYAIAFVVKGILVIFALLPVAVIVSVGTYFLFTQLSVYIIHKLKNNKKLYRSNTNMITLSDLAYRMKDNARMFFLVAIISTVAFTAIGTLVGIKSMFTNMMSASTPPLKYVSYVENKQAGEHTALIEQMLGQENIAFESMVIKKKSAADTETDKDYSFIAASDYNRIIKGDVAIGKDEARLFYADDLNMGYDRGSKGQEKKLTLMDRKLTVTENTVMPSSLMQSVGGSNIAVVSDDVFQALPKSESDSAMYVYDVADWKQTLGVSKKLMKELKGNGEHYRFSSRAYELNDINQGFGQILLTGLFIGAVFFVAAGSFLYFRLYADLDNDRIQYRAISKLGLTEGELSKIASTQIGLLFFVPIIVAVIHGAVALNTLQNTFNQNLVVESSLVLGSFLVIQIIYFVFIRANYVKKLKSVM
ncbi:FtsX-like permease family protein [Paenibacillus apiarius]|uniref:ABC transporter permease n=1 Tax=Paenibacillus apiarius TaxID=46240 RepID=A0ABT4DMV9_9BACL|nr:ABC transporter permease [Paenibacillus apiarius]MCY9514699.1 ABC transporter permease [Paenibacillus apiarius]MCY9518689.1 ABC transporter permease [Paenibacillus apiarius]MCY9552870.1 ABC transporter permease [Paenibacillus apiarius]MCY9556895.1 ABC transporter permease [Paenibacillus apiarius]MCY9686152.1 ABC transporter permease [Paenibacillus apiarius]